MAGIEKITGEIIEAANLKAEAIIADANKQAKAILEQAKTEADNTENEILATAGKKADSIKSAAESACALDAKNKVLQAKMNLINKAFEQSIEKLKTLDSKTYFSVIKRLVINYAVKGNGVLVLCEKDKNALPDNFKSVLDEALPSEKKIQLSDKVDNSIEGGCIIKYDEIEINCTFDAIINSEKERLIDCVNNALFN